MDATPFEHDVDHAEAEEGTGDCTVAPLLGAETLTPANAAGTRRAERHTISWTYFCMQQFSKGLFACDAPKPTACETALCARAGRAEESQKKVASLWRWFYCPVMKALEIRP